MNTVTTMQIETLSSAIPSQILYTMIRTTNLERSISFYRDALGMQEIRRETFTEGRFTLVFLGYSEESPNALIELTYNWDQSHYVQGTGYGHIALEVVDIYAACDRLKKMGAKVMRKPGPMTFAVDETGDQEEIAFIEDPDGYKIELIKADK